MKYFKWPLLFCILFWGLVFYACQAWAGPYLTCDCTPAVDQVTGFKLQFGAQTPIDVPTFTVCQNEPACGSGQYRICYDLVSLPAGPYSITAAAVNLWGMSTYTNPLSGSKVLPSGFPQSLKIVR